MVGRTRIRVHRCPRRRSRGTFVLSAGSDPASVASVAIAPVLNGKRYLRPAAAARPVRARRSGRLRGRRHVFPGADRRSSGCAERQRPRTGRTAADRRPAHRHGDRQPHRRPPGRPTPVRFEASEALADFLDRPAEEAVPDADASEEFVTLGPDRLVGVLTRPIEAANDQGRLLALLNSGSDPHTGPGRAWVELARAVATGAGPRSARTGAARERVPTAVRSPDGPMTLIR
jgi:hypothetical protein